MFLQNLRQRSISTEELLVFLHRPIVNSDSRQPCHRSTMLLHDRGRRERVAYAMQNDAVEEILRTGSYVELTLWVQIVEKAEKIVVDKIKENLEENANVV
ncbi:Protein CBG20516 [Caenorhabditis briggsae]|uniref:Protein CBG20516 n=1 Tax=Caenorhabditis briggsae TaxID=6238 RepID=A8XXZ6_CAEBR|nr:Protein CBG20516 [Caenorhabditis briggsae]CAP37515.1 Protein CBG20516 [Caenorhabditis briggsae]